MKSEFAVVAHYILEGIFMNVQVDSDIPKEQQHVPKMRMAFLWNHLGYLTVFDGTKLICV